jgi:outer membrane lipoprotein LolB
MLPMRLLSLVPVVLLSACASAPLTVPDYPVGPYRESIELNGRLSVNYQKDGKPESLSGSFHWVQAPARIHVSLASPLGQTIAAIDVTPEQASLTQAGAATRSAATLDALTAQALGWALPVSGLRDWLQGYAKAQDGSRFMASPRNNTVTTADGWRLRFVSWQDEAAAQPVPKRIDAERPAEELSIRIIVSAGD